MPQSLKLKVAPRSLLGRKVKRLRQQHLLPGNVYGKEVKSLAIELPLKEFQAIFKQAGETNIIDLLVGKETKARPVLIHSIQVDPLSDEPLHADFRQVDLTKKITVAVPLELTGESPAVTKGGVLVKLINEVEVEALPKDLPDKFEVNIAGLEELGQGITLKEIKIDSAKVKLTAESLDELVVKVEAPAKEEVVAPPVAEVPAAATGTEAAPAEGEKKEEVKKAEPEEKKQKPDQGKKL